MKKLTASILSAMLMLSMVFSSSVFAANDATQASAWDSFVGLFTKATTTADTVGVQYKAHIQNKGTMTDYVTGPTEMGTRGEGLRMEGFWIKLTNAPADLKIKYDVQIENEGWLKNPDDVSTWFTDDQFAGSQDKSQRIETIKLVLVDSTGAVSKNYSVQYKGHVQNIGNVPENDTKYTGTTGWYADGEQLGTVGSSLRLEALQVQIVQKASDLTAYNAAVALANTAKAADYTTASYAALTKALADNVVTATDVQSKVDAATTAINAAYAALVPVAEFKVVSSSAIDTTGTVVALNGATVARNVSFEVKFSSALDAATVNTNTVKLFNGTELVAIDSPQSVNDTIKFKALSVLAADANYTLEIDGVKGTNGAVIAKTTVATFKAADTSVVKKITVEQLTPVSGSPASATLYNTASTDANAVTPVNSTWKYGQTQTASLFTVTFDEAIDRASLSSSSLKLVDVATGKTLAMEYGSDATTKSVSLWIVDSSKYLNPRSEYQLVFSGVKALDGSNVDPFAFSFVYQAAAPKLMGYPDVKTADGDLLATVKEAINPSTQAKMLDDGTTYKLGNQFVIDFGAANTKLDTATVTSDFFFIRERDTQVAVPVNVTYNSGANQVTVAPKADLKGGVEYELVQSPFVANIYGVTAGTTNSQAVKLPFTTLDVTAPTVVAVTSSADGNAFTNLPLDKPVTLYVQMSEKVAAPAIYNLATGTAVGFNTADGAGSILISRTDDENLGLNEGNVAAAGVQAVGLSADGKTIEITVDPAQAGTVSASNLKNAVQGKSFRVTLAGYTPTRANHAANAIVDTAPIPNTLDNDYSFTFTFTGDDTTAPKVTDTRAYVSTGDYTALEGATNVNGKIQLVLDDKTANINETTKPVATIANSAGTWTVAPTSIIYSEIGGNAVVEIADNATLTKAGATNTTLGDLEGSATLRVTGIKDMSANEAATYKADFVVGVGAKVDSISAVQLVNGVYGSVTDIAQAGVKVQFNELMKRTAITTDTVKLYDGTTLLTASIDYDFLADNNYVVLKPSTQLAANKTYTVVVSADVKDNAGNKLQQTGVIAKPADASLNITTGNSGAPVLSGSAVVDATKRTITFTFDQNIKASDVPTITLTPVSGGATATVAATEIKIEDKVATATVYSGLAANTQYTGTYKVESNDNVGKTTVVPVTVQTTTEWKNDDVRARPLVTNFAAAGSAFTLTFSEEVKIDDVKAALKVYNATEAKDVSLFSSSYAISDYLATDDKYAKTYVVTIPGYVSNDYYVSFAKETIKDYAGFTNKDAQDFSFSTQALADAKSTKIASLTALTTGKTSTDYTTTTWNALTAAITSDTNAINALTTVADVNAYPITASTNAEAALVKVVKTITVTGAGNATTITTNDGTLQMNAAVLPVDAGDLTVTWSVTAGTGTASISPTGELTAITNGTVTVKATAKDGSLVEGTVEITISGQV